MGVDQRDLRLKFSDAVHFLEQARELYGIFFFALAAGIAIATDSTTALELTGILFASGIDIVFRPRGLRLTGLKHPEASVYEDWDDIGEEAWSLAPHNAAVFIAEANRYFVIRHHHYFQFARLVLLVASILGLVFLEDSSDHKVLYGGTGMFVGFTVYDYMVRLYSFVHWPPFVSQVYTSYDQFIEHAKRGSGWPEELQKQSLFLIKNWTAGHAWLSRYYLESLHDMEAPRRLVVRYHRAKVAAARGPDYEPLRHRNTALARALREQVPDDTVAAPGGDTDDSSGTSMNDTAGAPEGPEPVEVPDGPEPVDVPDGSSVSVV